MYKDTDGGEVGDRREQLQREYEVCVVTTVLSELEEVSGADICTEAYYYNVVRAFYRIGASEVSRNRRRKWTVAVIELVNGRASNFLHTNLTFVMYYFGCASALVDALSGVGGTHPSGRITCAIFLSWLVPLALLCNTFGVFLRCIICLDVMVCCFEPVPGEAVPGLGVELRLGGGGGGNTAGSF